MKLSAPAYHLKRKARLMSRQHKIPLHQALDAIAADEGFGSWSLLATKASSATTARKLYSSLTAGDLLLIGARPGHGKTLMSLKLAVEAMKSGHRSLFFSLEYTEKDVRDRFEAIGANWAEFTHRFEFDSSNAISADYIIDRLATAPSGTLVVIDYLQILDQRRENPDLMSQIRALKTFARERGVIVVFVSQIDRSYDPSAKPCPDLGDIRLPNPLDLTLFSKTCFLNNGEVRFRAAA